MPTLSIQDDIGPVGTGPCVDPVIGVATGPDKGGTNVGLGASTSDMPTSKLDDLGLWAGGERDTLVGGVVGALGMTRVPRLCIR